MQLIRKEHAMPKYKKIVTLENQAQAQWVEAVLVERDIPHFMRTYHDSAYDGLFQAQMGWGHIEAPEEYEEEILSICNELFQTDDGQKED
jgi:hypothetical protein